MVRSVRVKWPRRRSGHPESGVEAQFRQTGSSYFPWAVEVGGRWWVLRLNNFPDHPLYTFFVGELRRFDLDDLPDVWSTSDAETYDSLSDAEARAALSPIKSFAAYGSEIGRPCDNPFCCG